MDGCSKFLLGLIVCGLIIGFGISHLDVIGLFLSNTFVSFGGFMEGILVLGSLGFYCFIVLVVATIIALIENKHEIWSLLVLLAGFSALEKYSGIHFIPFIIANPLIFVGMIAGYLVVGTIWGVLKWYLFLKKTKQCYNEVKDKYKKDEQFANMTEDEQNRTMSADLCESIGSNWRIDIRPKVELHKAAIMSWITYWPISIIWTCVGDGFYHLGRIVRDIYKNIATSLQRMADNVWKD